MSDTIHPATALGPVALTVADLTRSRAYYAERIGLNVLEERNGHLTLGAGAQPLLLLVEQPGARRVRNTTGLYHYALLLPSRVELARTLHHLIDSDTQLTGASDHAVSEALYLADPDGHGIEIYRDRPRSEWRYPGGTLKLTVDPFDAAGVLAELEPNGAPFAGLPAATIIGHVHLHVAEIAPAEHFYIDLIGFELMVRYGRSASFVAAGGYHHHLGLNIWAGEGAPPPPPDAARLLWSTLVLPNEAALRALLARLAAGSVPVEETSDGLFVQDPAANRWRLVVGQP